VTAPARSTEWIVITGPPSAGKTSVIEALRQRGHPVVAETARHYIASLRRSPSEIAGEPSLQRRIQHDISA
jgi:predicted ATPase